MPVVSAHSPRLDSPECRTIIVGMGTLRAAVGAVLLVVLASGSVATAAEYRLRVANLDENAYFHFAERDGHDSASPFVLRRLEPALEQSALPSGVFVTSRTLVPADRGRVRSFGAVEARPMPVQSSNMGQWEEIRWEGKPGERVVWIIQGEGVVRQGVVGVGLRGPGGEFRHYIPFTPGPGAWKVRAARIGLEFVDFWYGRDGLWTRVLGPRLDLATGIAAVVAENPNSVYADSVFLVIEQPPATTTYDVVAGGCSMTRKTESA